MRRIIILTLILLTLLLSGCSQSQTYIVKQVNDKGYCLNENNVSFRCVNCIGRDLPTFCSVSTYLSGDGVTKACGC